MRFSERKGYKQVSNIIQIEGVSNDLRNSLWNILYLYILNTNQFRNHNDSKNYFRFSIDLGHNFFKMQVDDMPKDHSSIVAFVKKYFFDTEWQNIYDFIEYTLNFFDSNELNEQINNIFIRELSGYRFVNGIITDITDDQEIKMLKTALTDDDFVNVKAHLQRALELLSDRKNPDYRNSIKESISAVESIAKEIAQKPKAELAEALKEIEKNGELHGALKKGFLSLYGYTSDADGIRHSLMAEPNLTADDAKFFLLVCTSFINYLKTKI